MKKKYKIQVGTSEKICILKMSAKENPFLRTPNETAGTSFVVKCWRTKLCNTTRADATRFSDSEFEIGTEFGCTHFDGTKSTSRLTFGRRG